MKFNCAYSNLVDIHKVIENPKNPNKHSALQIERLAKIIDYQGQRSPIVVSVRSGFITKGHGRLMAIRKLGWDKVAVDYQDYESEAQEYADIVADNAIAEWAELDMALVTEEIKLLEDFDIELLGVEICEAEKLEEKEIDINFEYKIEVDCGDEDKQKYLTGELQDRGFKVRILL